jgi:predicted 3-demethylubiquinone-9 3-methyltransferase (glyoxalase superfamily)
MQKINTFLWFDGQAEQAVAFYLSVFPKAKAGKVLRWGDVGPGPKGSVLTASFELMGQEFTAINGGPQYKFTPAISLMIPCDTQQEVDDYWNKLLAGGGEPSACGWLTDKFGVSWQVTPVGLLEMLMDKDQAKANRVMAAMMEMVKLDIPTLRKAYEAS